MDEKITAIQQAFPTTTNQVYLNTGSVGPWSTIANEVLLREQAIELAEGRGSMGSYGKIIEFLPELRESFAQLLHCHSDNIALTHHTTDGLNIGIHGVNWQQGDEIITTNWEHPGGYLPIYVVQRRYGVRIRTVNLSTADTDETILEKFKQVISPRTRMMTFSHVTWNTGQILPLKQLAELARKHHILTVIDGAQTIGHMPLDLPELGIDLYAMPAQKWLCGPEGLGICYVRSESIERFDPTFVGYMSMQYGKDESSGYYLPQPNAQRFEVGGIFRPMQHAMLAQLNWMKDEIGWEWIYNRILDNAQYAYQQLQKIGATMITPAPVCGLITFTFDGIDASEVTTSLQEQNNIIVRYLPDPYALRIATGFYTSKKDIDTLIKALETHKSAVKEKG